MHYNVNLHDNDHDNNDDNCNDSDSDSHSYNDDSGNKLIFIDNLFRKALQNTSKEVSFQMTFETCQ